MSTSRRDVLPYNIMHVLACDTLHSSDLIAIVMSLDNIRTSLYTPHESTNLYQYAQDFNFAREQQRLADFLESGLFIRSRMLWESIFSQKSLLVINDDDDLPENFIYMLIDRDDQSRPTRFLVGLHSQMVDHRINYDLFEIQKRASNIVSQRITCLRDVNKIEAEIATLLNALRLSIDNDRMILINSFNRKYAGQLYLNYNVDDNLKTAKYDVRDNSNSILFEGTHLLSPMQHTSQRNDQTSLSSSFANFWHESNVAKAAVIVGAAAGIGLAIRAMRRK